jgi:hypothetical protein
MYVHLGGEVVVPIQEIVGIFDSRMIQENEDNRRFMDICRSRGSLRSDIPKSDVKSVVVTVGGVYTSPISSMTLVRRVMNVQWGLSAVEGQGSGRGLGSPD